MSNTNPPKPTPLQIAELILNLTYEDMMALSNAIDSKILSHLKMIETTTNCPLHEAIKGRPIYEIFGERNTADILIGWAESEVG